MSKEQKTIDDQAKILEKVQLKIENEMEMYGIQADEDEEEALLGDKGGEQQDEQLKKLVIKLRKEKQLIEEANAEAKKDDERIQEMRNEIASSQADKQEKEQMVADMEEHIKKIKAKHGKGIKKGVPKQSVQDQLMSLFKICCAKKEKNKTQIVPFKDKHKDDKIKTSKQNRLEFLEKQRIFKYYLALNFYEDNVATVEIAQNTSTGSKLITASFMMPAFCKHLTDQTRDAIPSFKLQVSQQEKLEAFQNNIVMLKDEMKWQQKLGQFSPTVKQFANNWMKLSYVNLTIIIVTNILFVLTLKYDEFNNVQYNNKDQRNFVQLVSTIQTAIAMIVMVSYYLQYRSTFLLKIALKDNSAHSSIQDYGLIKGSNAYGKRMSALYDVKIKNKDVFREIEKYSQDSLIIKLVLNFTREVYYFVRAVSLDMPHCVNVMYVLISIGSLGSDLLNAILLLDIIKKIPQLSLIFDIFYEQGKSLGYTLALCLVILHIFSFYAFLNFHEDFQAAAGPDDDDGPDFNMYCSSLQECLSSTTNIGLRAGGGLGEGLYQPTNDSSLFFTRQLFDFAFFLIVNIILLNIFFGIIIDAFADKRQLVKDQAEEVDGKCFICGLSKSKFDIENIPWKLHVYSQHNLHSYLAFILYVQDKPMTECTGVEKYVKGRLREKQVDFYPLFRCLAIRGGEEVVE